MTNIFRIFVICVRETFAFFRNSEAFRSTDFSIGAKTELQKRFFYADLIFPGYRLTALQIKA
jgi:hypothetical protein